MGQKGPYCSPQGQRDTSLALLLALCSYGPPSPLDTTASARWPNDLAGHDSHFNKDKLCDGIIAWCLCCELIYCQMTQINKFSLKTENITKQFLLYKSTGVHVLQPIIQYTVLDTWFVEGSYEKYKKMKCIGLYDLKRWCICQIIVKIRATGDTFKAIKNEDS